MSLNKDITDAYYATTANRGHQASRAYYEQASGLLRRRLAPWLPRDKGEVCVDLACGCGELLYMLESQGYTRTTGVDLCAEELDQARAFVRGELVLSDVIEDLRRRPDGSVGLLTALNLIEHLKKDAMRELLIEARRVLRPGGALIAMVPNALSPFGTSTRYWDMTHEWAFTPNNFRQLAALTGFRPDVDFRECGPSPHGIKSAVRYALWQGIRAAIASYYLIEVATTRGGVYTMDMLVRMRRDG